MLQSVRQFPTFRASGQCGNPAPDAPDSLQIDDLGRRDSRHMLVDDRRTGAKSRRLETQKPDANRHRAQSIEGTKQQAMLPAWPVRFKPYFAALRDRLTTRLTLGRTSVRLPSFLATVVSASSA